MCGILGALPSVNESNFNKALNTLSHRGPDGFGIWSSIDEKVTLGHRRLSILDLSDMGRQPMHYAHLSITFNGEIYNFLEIRKNLIVKGYFFESDSDTEVILASYLEWGTDCFAMFNGMWAMAIWDAKIQKLLLSRDRYGKKPLFYAMFEDRFVFGSEMKAIAPFLPSSKKSEDFNWCKFNIYAYEATDKCLVDGIKRFPAGSYGFYLPNTGQLEIKQFWNTLDYVKVNNGSYEDQVEEFSALFEDACRIRMRADVKTGTALSGGLDSSVIAAFIHKINNEKDTSKNERLFAGQEAVIATFPGSKLDESEYARLVVDHLGIKGSFIETDSRFSEDKLKDYIYKFEELYTTPPHPMIETYKAIKSAGITVSIDGHGADELLSGYNDNIYEAFIDANYNLKAIQEIIATKRALSGENFTTLAWLDVIKYPIGKNLKRLLHLANRSNKLNIGMPVPLPKFIPTLGHFNSLLYHGFTNTTLPTLLRNFDRFSMAASVEVRMPFLDYRLVNFCFSLPFTSKLRNGYTKSILRDVGAPYLPNAIVRRKGKIGFNAPVAKWMQEGWKEYMNDTINSKEFEECEVINPAKIKKMFLAISTGKSENYNSGYYLWRDFSPFLWQKYFLKEVGKPLDIK
jgi:asparagine synthase (glutamine-hydrolysing)